MTSRERVLAHLEGRPVDHLPLMPITMMFATDRIGVPYGDYATDHRVMVEAQIHVSEEFGFDYVTVISDPAREAADLGAAVEYPADQPPALIESRALLADKTALAGLKVPDPHAGRRMRDRIEGVALFKQRLGDEKLIEGWVEGPCAEAADLRGINTVMLDFFDDAVFVRDLFDFIVEMELRFAKAQVDAGADIIGVGDAAASLVGPRFYDEFIWPYEKKLVDGLHAMGTPVRLHICGDTRHILDGIGRLGCEIVDLDYLAPVSQGRDKMGPEQMILGNIDPVRVLRNQSPDSVTTAIETCHREAGTRYVVAPGCEVPRDTPLENLRALADYAHTHTPEPAAA